MPLHFIGEQKAVTSLGYEKGQWKWGPEVGKQLKFSEQENQRMRTYQTHGLPHTDKSCSEVVTVHFICMLAGSEIVP